MIEQLRKLILKDYPSLDIRTDQCPTMRIIGKEIIIFVRFDRGEYCAQVIAYSPFSDFKNNVVDNITSCDSSKLIDKLKAHLSSMS